MVLVNKASGRQRHHGLSTHRPVTDGGIENINVHNVRTALNEEPYTPEPDKELPDWTGPERSAEDSAIPGAPELNDEQLKETEDKAFEQIRQSRVLDVDAVLPHIPGYNEAHPLTRDRAYRRTARDITRKLLDRLLAEPKKTGKVIIVSGGVGSGKSEVATALPSSIDFAIESTLEVPEYAAALMDHLRANGREIEIRHVHRDFKKSLEGLLARHVKSKANGNEHMPRITDLREIVSSHLGSLETLRSFRSIPVTILNSIENSLERRKISLEELEKTYHNQNHEHVGRNGPRSGKSGGHGKKNSGTGSPNAGDLRRGGTEERLGKIGLEIIEGFRTSGRLTNAEAAAFAGGVGQIQIQYQGTHEAVSDRGIPAGEIGSARRSILALGREIRGPGTGEDFGNSHRSLAAWARSSGRLIDPQWWEQKSKTWDVPHDSTEHSSYQEPRSRRTLRIVKPSSPFASSSPEAYLENIELNNLVFADDIRIEGVVELKGPEGDMIPFIVTSQPVNDGPHPTETQVDDWMTSKGYAHESGHSYYNRDTDIRVTNATPQNFIRIKGITFPIDLNLESNIPVEELYDLIDP